MKQTWEKSLKAQGKAFEDYHWRKKAVAVDPEQWTK